MSPRKSTPIVVPTSLPFALAKNLSDLIGMPLLLTKWEIVAGKDRDYFRIHFTHRDTLQKYLVGTNATTVVEQLQSIDAEPNPPLLMSTAQLGKMYTLCEYVEPSEDESDMVDYEQPTDNA